MRVIHPGKKDTKAKRFTCTGCGCVFEAERGEYTVVGHTAWAYDGMTTKCVCPCCGKMAYSK